MAKKIEKKDSEKDPEKSPPKEPAPQESAFEKAEKIRTRPREGGRWKIKSDGTLEAVED